MPLVRIAMHKGRSPAEIRSIVCGVQQALVDTFDVPPTDHFVLVQQHEPGDFNYDPGYLGVQRSDDIVIIHIVAINKRSTAMKLALYRAVADYLARDPGLRPEDVQIILSPNGQEDWSLGNGVASYVKKEKV